MDDECSLSALLPAVRADIPALLDDVAGTLDTNWPDYARFLRHNGTEVAKAAETALQRLLLADERSDGVEQQLFEEIGRLQWEVGRDLADLLSAYQAGAGVCWRHLSSIAVAARVAPAEFASLAGAVFSLVDHLTSCSARGYVREQAMAAGARERRRDELAALLLSRHPDTEAIRAAADLAAWSVPDEATVLLLPPGPVAERLLNRLDVDHLPIRRPGLLGTILPRPTRPGMRTRLTQTLRGTQAVVGRAAPITRLATSLQIVQIAADLQRRDVITDDPLFVDDHLDAIIVHRDDSLLDALQDQVLRPFEQCRNGSRERLVATLLSWLQHMGERQAMAAELHVHPQTVSYRLARLHELFGTSLDDPAVRARLLLALAWDRFQVTDRLVGSRDGRTPGHHRMPITGTGTASSCVAAPTRTSRA